VSNKKDRYIVFDLMRGLAALAVLLYHMGYMLGPYAPNMHKGYLAVDFFFILSGFVIAANYHVSVRPVISWFDFLSARFARLWPLFMLATLLGCVVVTAKLTRDSGYLDTSGVLLSLSLNSLMLPSFFHAYGVDRLFLFNGASWSVFFEVFINIVFFAILRKLSLRPLLILTGIFAGFIFYAAAMYGSLDGGWAIANFYIGAIRVLFGFSAGMVIYLISQKIDLQLNTSITLGLITCLCLAFFVKGGWLIDSAIVVIVFPLLMIIGSKCSLYENFSRVGSFLGDISYSVYLLQTPFMLITAAATQVLLNRKIADYSPFSGILFIVTLMTLSYLSWRYFEIPSRNYIRKKLAQIFRE
jgi:peptidoglycan/LPS O-acetylase OafA/YrhL